MRPPLGPRPSAFTRDALANAARTLRCDVPFDVADAAPAIAALDPPLRDLVDQLRAEGCLGHADLVEAAREGLTVSPVRPGDVDEETLHHEFWRGVGAAIDRLEDALRGDLWRDGWPIEVRVLDHDAIEAAA